MIILVSQDLGRNNFLMNFESKKKLQNQNNLTSEAPTQGQTLQEHHQQILLQFKLEQFDTNAG